MTAQIGNRSAPQVTVFAGTFASQPLAFAHLLDAADRTGLALDLDHVEVISAPVEKRLAHVLDADACLEVEAKRKTEESLVLVFSEALIPGAVLFAKTGLLRPVGTFTPIRARSLR